MAPSYRIEAKSGNYAGVWLSLLLSFAFVLNCEHIFSYFYQSTHWRWLDFVLLACCLLFLVAQARFSMRLFGHWCIHVPKVMMLKDNGEATIEQKQFCIDSRSVYFGNWILLIFNSVLLANKKRLILGPDSLNEMERRRIKRIIKRSKQA